MRSNGRFLAGLVTVILAVLLILLAIPITVVTGYIPAAVVAHKLIWILILALGMFAAAALTWWLWRRSPDGDTPSAPEAGSHPVCPGQIVVGEIPREPPAFVDRAVISRLAEAARSGRAAVVCAVTGLRGVGKTQVAAAYARSRIKDGWGLVGWVNAESADVLLAGLTAVAEAAGVADPKGDPGSSARRLRDYLGSRASPGLLVIDNATDPDALRPFLPATGRTQLVVTSIDRAFADWGVPVDVSVFSRRESTGYLARRTSLDDLPGADSVAQELGDLPLALAQAAAVIRRRRWTFLAYLGELGRVPVETLLGRVRGGDYPRSAAAALLLSVQAVEDTDPGGSVPCCCGWSRRCPRTGYAGTCWPVFAPLQGTPPAISMMRWGCVRRARC